MDTDESAGPRTTSGETTPTRRPVMTPALAEALFDASPFSSVLYDAEGRILAVNPAFERLWGVTLETAPPGYSVLTDPELERQGALPAVRRAFAGETVATPPVRYDISHVSTTGEGRTVWTQGYFYPVRDEVGRVAWVVLTHVDLTEQKRAEEALAQQEERLRLAQRAAGIGTFDWEVPTGRLTWTEEEERLFGLEPGTFEGTIEGWTARVLPEDEARMREAMGAAMARGEREMDFAFRIRRPDGEVRWIEGSAEFQYAEDGRPLRMVGVNVDVTERRRAEEALQRSEALLRQAERIAHIGSWEWDLETGALRWSEELYRIYGLDSSAGEVTYERFLACVPLEDQETIRRAVERARADGRPFAFDHRIVRPDGAVRYLHGRGRVATDEQGRAVRLIGSGQDITERKEAEVALRRAKEEAEEASRAKSEFLAVMSHELRTPLNAIAGYAELMELGIYGPLTDGQRDGVRRIQESERHLLGLINEVLNYTRVEAGAVSYELEAVPVGEALQAARALVLPQVGARGLSLDVSPPAGDVAAWADRDKLQQVLLNLLTNAVKFTEPGGRITMDAEPSDDVVLVHVRDTGIGIAPEKVESIFEPFVQVGRALNRPTEGTGLGLAISRELARRMGGDLTARSEPGAGSTFTLRLPRHVAGTEHRGG